MVEMILSAIVVLVVGMVCPVGLRSGIIGHVRIDGLGVMLSKKTVFYIGHGLLVVDIKVGDFVRHLLNIDEEMQLFLFVLQDGLLL